MLTPAMRTAGLHIAIACCGPAAVAAQAPGWPQAAGPAGNWNLAVADAPTRWSVSRNEHILWRTPLPNGGQGNLAVAGGRIFLATFPEYTGGARKGNAILGHAIEQKTGRI